MTIHTHHIVHVDGVEYEVHINEIKQSPIGKPQEVIISVYCPDKPGGERWITTKKPLSTAIEYINWDKVVRAMVNGN